MGKIENFRTASIALLCIVCAFVVSACGGGGGSSSQTAGVGGTGITSARGLVQGKITSFGSIYVNGLKFNTDSSSFTVDGDAGANQDDLAVGMIVTLEVETENGSYTGKALQVVYDDEVQGPVSLLSPIVSGSAQRTLNVFGQVVAIDETGTLFRTDSGNPGFGFDTIKNDDVIEISGFRTSDSTVTATYVEWKETLVNGSEVELRGTVSGYLPPVQQFMLDGVLVTFDNNTEIDVSGGLANDVYVEVKGEYNVSGPSVAASEIEQEDESFGDEVDDVSLQGIISEYAGNDDFKINGLPIDASGATELSPANVLSLLGDGVEVEVEGSIVAGKLIADEVELREGETELRTTVSAIALPDRFQVEYPGLLPRIWINVDGQTLFEDEDDSDSKTPLENFSIEQLGVGNFVKIEGIAESGEVTAQTVKRLEPGDSSKLQGAVDTFDRDVSITILGVEYPLDPGVSYGDSMGGNLSNDEFFDLLKVLLDGNLVTIVELEDDEPDAAADNVEFDD